MLERIDPSLLIAQLVSSQEDSMARIVTGLVIVRKIREKRRVGACG
jgi:hypothetical protein